MTELFSNAHNDSPCYSNDAYKSLWAKVLLCCKFIYKPLNLGIIDV
jgi:hypothetical protein